MKDEGRIKTGSCFSFNLHPSALLLYHSPRHRSTEQAQSVQDGGAATEVLGRVVPKCVD
jgi:hypothetical protein